MAVENNFTPIVDSVHNHEDYGGNHVLTVVNPVHNVDKIVDKL